MPIYTYRCESCGVNFDRRQKFSEQPLTRCPECGRKSLHKVYAPVGIVFKGSGFYITDHRSPSDRSRSAGTNEESKPASKNEITETNTPSSSKSGETKEQSGY